MTTRIKLIGCNRYAYGPKGEVFEKGFEYELDDEKAALLLNSNNDKGMPYFARVEAPAPKTKETVVEEATGEGIGGVRIVRRRAAPVPNPRVKTAGDTSPLRDDGKPEPASRDEEDLEGVEL